MNADNMPNRNLARELFRESALSYSDLTPKNLRRLRHLINSEMILSKCMRGSLRCKQRHTAQLDDSGAVIHAQLRCRSFNFENREAVSFNRDGFIGFAGWSDNTNIVPILAGFTQWVIELDLCKIRQ